MNIRKFKLEEDIFSKSVQEISKIYHEVLLLFTFLQSEPRVINMDINCYDLYYTVNKKTEMKKKL